MSTITKIATKTLVKSGKVVKAHAGLNSMDVHEVHVGAITMCLNHVAEFAQGEQFKMVSKGGGGTDFRPPFEYVEREGITPACLIYLTDGYGPFPQNPPPYPVLWAMTTDVVPPWGEYVKVEV